MPPQEQAELWMQLRDRMKVDWNEMTLQEKKAGMSDHFTISIKLLVSLYLQIYEHEAYNSP